MIAEPFPEDIYTNPKHSAEPAFRQSAGIMILRIVGFLCAAALLFLIASVVAFFSLFLFALQGINFLTYKRFAEAGRNFSPRLAFFSPPCYNKRAGGISMNRKQRKEELLKYIERIRDDEGYAVVDVSLGEGVELYDPLSLKRDLNGEIYDYIEAQTNVIPATVPLRIRFHGNFRPEEQEEIKQTMHRHYVMKSFDISWDLIANFRKTLLLALFGAAVLAVYLYLALSSENALMTEILSVIGSFSLWEAVDAFLLERPHLRRDNRNNEQSLNQRIEFVPNAEN